MDQAATVALVRALGRGERRLFEQVGASAAAASDRGDKVLLNELARHHAWRAEQWAALDPGTASSAGDDPLAGVIAGLPTAGVPGGPSSLSTWLDVVGPALRSAYEAAAEVDDVAGGPVRRTAARCLADLELDLRGVLTRRGEGSGPIEVGRSS